MDNLVKRLNGALGGVETPSVMHGDNLSIVLCTAFENAYEEPDESGWGQSALEGCEATLEGIRAHYAPLADRIEALTAERDALEAEKSFLTGEMDVILTGRADEYDRAEAAEAKLAQGVEFVEGLLSGQDRDDDWRVAARAFLASVNPEGKADDNA